MARRKKLTGLDAVVCQMWDDLTFPNGRYWGIPTTLDDYKGKQLKRKSQWDAIFVKAYQNGEWQVSNGIASLVSCSRWSDLMAFREYGRAVELIERCMAHSKPFDPSELVDLQIRLQIAILGRDGDGEAAKTLESMISSGVLRPSMMARQIEVGLGSLGEHIDREAAVPEEIISLLLAIAVARRHKKRYVGACRHIETWGDAIELLEAR